jgi:Flp pilus assembly protein TadD
MGALRNLVAAAVIAILCAASFARTAVYENDITLYKDVTVKSPRKARAFNNLGDAFIKSGRPDDARAPLEQALALDPDYPDALNNLATVEGHDGRRDEAMRLIAVALSLEPNHRQALFNMAMMYYESGMLVQAADLYSRIITLFPWSSEADFSRKMLALLRSRAGLAR